MTAENKALREEFESLRCTCEDNPALLLEGGESLKSKYNRLEDQHIKFFKAYALIKLQRLEQALELIEGILSKAVIENDMFLLIHAHLLLSRCYPTDLPKQHSCLKIAEDYARSSGDSSILAEVFSVQGDLLLVYHNYVAAEEKHLIVQKILEREDNPAHKMRSLLSLANIKRAQKKIPQAVSYLKEALAICRNHQYKKYELIILNRMAMIQIDSQNYEEAELLLQSAIRLCDTLGLTVQKIQAIFSMGALYLTRKDTAKARQNFEDCKALALKVGFDNPSFVLDLQYNMGEVYQLQGDLVQATACYEQAQALAHAHGIEDAEQELLLARARVSFAQKDFQEAEKLLRNSLKLAGRNVETAYTDETWELLAKLYQKTKDYPKCVQTQQKHISFLRNQIKKVQETQERICEQKSLDSSVFLEDSITSCNQGESYGFVGNSLAHKRVLDAALLAAQYPNVNVLLMGESGTGKEVIANIIHQHSLRRHAPFVPFNAAAISPNLVESELFGHTKGSFTGAISDNKGFFQRAEKGTLFIDEISEMPLEIQAKLLRALESRRINPVGGSSEMSIDCRVITATNLNIYDLIKTNQFRLDLFHRINTIEIYIPPLRDRKEDIPLLLQYFVRQFAKEFNKTVPEIRHSFIMSLQNYEFPGNVRELKNLVERLFILGGSSSWDESILSTLSSIYPRSKPLPQAAALETAEADKIKDALMRCKGVQKEAAALLKISNSTLCRRIAKFQLEAFTRKGC